MFKTQGPANNHPIALIIININNKIKVAAPHRWLPHINIIKQNINVPDLVLSRLSFSSLLLLSSGRDSRLVWCTGDAC